MKAKLKESIVLVVVFVAGLTASVANAELVAHWAMDGNANDSVGSNDGTVYGTPNWETGRFGGALAFDGDDHIVLPNESDFDITDAITVAAWIKVATFDKQWQTIISKGDDAWRLSRHGADNRVAFHCTGLTIDGSRWGIESSVNMNDRRWHHVAGIYDGTSIHIYVDGELDRSRKASGKIGKGDHKVCIGTNAQKQQREWNGLIDDVVIFDHALKEDEIVRLYRLGGGGIYR